MSFTASAACWMPSPRWSSLKTLIWEDLNAGRHGSLFANFTPESGSRITTERRPDPCCASSAARRASATSFVWNLTSQNSSRPSTCSIQRSAGFIVWKFEVRWSIASNPKAFPPPRGAACRIIPGYIAGDPRRSTKRKVVSASGVVTLKVRSVPPGSRCSCTSLIGVPPRSSRSRKQRSASSTSNTTVPTPSGCLRR